MDRAVFRGTWAYFGQCAQIHGTAYAESLYLLGFFWFRPADYQSDGLNPSGIFNDNINVHLLHKLPSVLCSDKGWIILQ